MTQMGQGPSKLTVKAKRQKDKTTRNIKHNTAPIVPPGLVAREACIVVPRLAY